MISEKRIKLMTKLAEFEQDKGADIELVRTHYRSDYISVHLLKNLLRITVAFIVGFALWACYNAEKVLEMLNTMDIVGFGIRLLVIYGITIVISMILSYILYTMRFYQNEKQFQDYKNMLQQLISEYDLEKGVERPRSSRRRRERGGRGNDDTVKL